MRFPVPSDTGRRDGRDVEGTADDSAIAVADPDQANGNGPEDEAEPRISVLERAKVAIIAQGRRLADGSRAGLERVRHFWHALSHRQQHWVQGIIVGLLIEVVLIQAGGFSVLVGIKNATMDATMRSEAYFDSISSGNRPAKLTFIDVDEATWRDPLWGEPYRAPRQQVAKLVRYAFDHGAKIVVLDILVETSGQDDAKSVGDDQALIQLLSTLTPDQKLIFSRSIREPLQPIDDPVARVAPVMPASPLDGIASSGSIIGAVPQFQIDRDGQVRSWELWQPVCVPDAPGAATGQWRPMPSVQLAVIALTKTTPHSPPPPWSTATGFGRCATELSGVAAKGLQSAAKASEALHAWTARVELSETHEAPEIAAAQDVAPRWRHFEPGSRIYYRSVYDPTKCQKPGIQRVSALAVLAQAQATYVDVQCGLPDRLAPIVLIGQSADAVGDKWSTPLGPMPGAYVIANAILSLERTGLLAEPPKSIELTLVLVHIVVIAWAFAWFSSGRAVALVGIPLLLGLVLLNWFYLRFGVWIDYATPAAGIWLHRLEGQARSLFAGLRTRAP